MEYKVYTDGELYHWGVRGMRWGVRRYQNKDGSLTKAGQRRYNKEMARLKEEERVVKNKERTQSKLSKLTQKEAELEARNRALKGEKKQDDAAPRNKSISEMTDDELREKTNRMILENNYYTMQKNLAASTPQKVSRGKQFMDGLVNEVIAPAAKNAGKAWLENTLKDKLGLNDVDPLKKLENKYKKLEWEKKIKDIQKDPEGDDDLVKALEFFRNTSPEDRTELKDAASMFENMDKIRKKGKSKD